MNDSKPPSLSSSRVSIMKKEDGKKMWRVKPKTDEEILSSIDDVETDTILTCDCTCKECKVLYKSYLEAKVSNDTLTESLKDEKIAMTDTIEQIVALEKAHAVQISDSNRSLEAAQRKIDELNKELIVERSLRMEELYRIDFQTKECAESLKELETYKKLANRLTLESQSYEFEKQQIQHKLNKMTEAYNEAMRQVKKYEMDIFHMEEKLDHFRLRVNSSDSSVNQLKLRNENLLARLNPNYHLKAVVSGRPGVVSSVDEGQLDIESILKRDYGGSVSSSSNSSSTIKRSNGMGLTLSDIASSYRGNTAAVGRSDSSAYVPSSSGSVSLVSAGGSGFSLDHLYSGVVNASGFKYRPDSSMATSAEGDDVTSLLSRKQSGGRSGYKSKQWSDSKRSSSSSSRVNLIPIK